jgi:hypothetical protein
LDDELDNCDLRLADLLASALLPTAAHCPLLPTVHCCPLPTTAHCCPLLPTALLPTTAHCCPLLPTAHYCPLLPTAAHCPLLPTAAHCAAALHWLELPTALLPCAGWSCLNGLPAVYVTGVCLAAVCRTVMVVDPLHGWVYCGYSDGHLEVGPALPSTAQHCPLLPTTAHCADMLLQLMQVAALCNPPAATHHKTTQQQASVRLSSPLVLTTLQFAGAGCRSPPRGPIAASPLKTVTASPLRASCPAAAPAPGLDDLEAHHQLHQMRTKLQVPPYI